jgi:hypothetical protein
LTRDWWTRFSQDFDLFVSSTVVQECSAGDPQAAQERLVFLTDVSVLDVTSATERLAEELLKHVPLPEKAAIDALHIALAATHGIDYLLTWNCTHIANAIMQLCSIESN